MAWLFCYIFDYIVIVAISPFKIHEIHLEYMHFFVYTTKCTVWYENYGTSLLMQRANYCISGIYTKCINVIHFFPNLCQPLRSYNIPFYAGESLEMLPNYLCYIRTLHCWKYSFVISCVHKHFIRIWMMWIMEALSFGCMMRWMVCTIISIRQMPYET